MKSFSIIVLMALILTACDSGNSSKESKQLSSEQKELKSKPEKDSLQTILFFGNSITAGYGLTQEQAFPNLIQQKIDSLGWPFKAVNAGLSGETTAGGLGRVSWLTEQYDIDVLFLALGGNDGLRGIDPASSVQNLIGIIDSVSQAFPEASILVAGMEAPPNMGDDYTSEFRNIYPKVTLKREVTLMPFLLKDVAGEKELNQADGIHPTAKGQKIVAKNVWEVLKPMLEERMKSKSR